MVSCVSIRTSTHTWLTHDLGIDFSHDSVNKCTNPSTYLPVSLFQNSEPFQQGNYTTYDQWAKTTTPVLFAVFGNETILNVTGVDFAQSYLTCMNPMNVTAGSHVPTSAAGQSVAVHMKSVMGFALAVNALAFLML